MRKRILAAILCCLLVIPTVLPVTAAEKDEKEVPGQEVELPVISAPPDIEELLEAVRSGESTAAYKWYLLSSYMFISDLIVMNRSVVNKEERGAELLQSLEEYLRLVKVNKIAESSITTEEKEEAKKYALDCVQPFFSKPLRSVDECLLYWSQQTELDVYTMFNLLTAIAMKDGQNGITYVSGLQAFVDYLEKENIADFQYKEIESVTDGQDIAGETFKEYAITSGEKRNILKEIQGTKVSVTLADGSLKEIQPSWSCGEDFMNTNQEMYIFNGFIPEEQELFVGRYSAVGNEKNKALAKIVVYAEPESAGMYRSAVRASSGVSRTELVYAEDGKTYIYFQAENLSAYSQIQVPTWTAAYGQDDIVWGTAATGKYNVEGISYNCRYLVSKQEHLNTYLGYTSHFYGMRPSDGGLEALPNAEPLDNYNLAAQKGYHVAGCGRECVSLWCGTNMPGIQRGNLIQKNVGTWWEVCGVCARAGHAGNQYLHVVDARDQYYQCRHLPEQLVGHYRYGICGRNGGTATMNTLLPEWGHAFSFCAGHFTANNYSIQYRANGGNGGSMSNSFHTYDAAKELTANQYSKTYTITFDSQGGTPVAELRVPAQFKGWSQTETGGVAFKDQQSVKNLSVTNGDVVKLYAKWKDTAVNLPIPSKERHEFLGWESEDGTLAATPEQVEYTPNKNTVLKARWKFINTPPVLTGEDIWVFRTDALDKEMLRKDAKAVDEHDGDITEKIEVKNYAEVMAKFEEVKKKKPETGKNVSIPLIYGVEDMDKAAAELEVQLIVVLGEEEERRAAGYVRFISEGYVDGIDAGSVWNTPGLKGYLKGILGKDISGMEGYRLE